MLQSTKFGRAIKAISRGVATGEAWYAAWSIIKPIVLPIVAALVAGWRAMIDGLSWPIVCVVAAGIFASGLIVVRYLKEARAERFRPELAVGGANTPTRSDRLSPATNEAEGELTKLIENTSKLAAANAERMVMGLKTELDQANRKIALMEAALFPHGSGLLGGNALIDLRIMVEETNKNISGLQSSVGEMEKSYSAFQLEHQRHAHRFHLIEMLALHSARAELRAMRADAARNLLLSAPDVPEETKGLPEIDAMELFSKRVEGFSAEVKRMAPYWELDGAEEIDGFLARAEREIDEELDRHNDANLSGRDFGALRRYFIAKKRMESLRRFCENSAQFAEHRRATELLNFLELYHVVEPGPRL